MSLLKSLNLLAKNIKTGSLFTDEKDKEYPSNGDNIDVTSNNIKENSLVNKQSDLNDQQRYAVSYEGKHLLVLAGAGSGKTKTLIERAKYLIQKGVPAGRIIILSFTKKSAREIADRIKLELHSSDTDGLVGQTFHSWCMSIIRNNPNIFKESNYSVLDEDDRMSCFKLLAGKGYKKQYNLSPTNILNVYSYAVNTLCSLSDAIRIKVYSSLDDNSAQSIFSEEIKCVKPYYEQIIRRYIAYKKDHKFLDYDDILNIVAKAMKQNEEVKKCISSLYDYILVDEMQDTNPLQYQLLSSFKNKCHLFCVGDDAQSIYSFRGADFKTIHSFSEKVEDSEICKLVINYRSTKGILDLANWLLQQSPLGYDKDLKAYRGPGVKPEIVHFSTNWQEANDITDLILESISSKGCLYKDNMVLSRTIFGLKSVEAACITKKIPYHIFGGTGLMQSKHIRDVLSPMRIVSNYRDELAWLRYLCLWKGIGEVTAAKIISQVIQEPSLERCLDSLNTLGLQEEIHGTLDCIKNLQNYVSKALDLVLDSMNVRLLEIYGEEWKWRSKDFDILKLTMTSITSLSEFLAEYVMDPQLATIKKLSGKDEDVVILSTIHSAKGLEAENCYVVDVSPYSYPTPRAVSDGEDAVEEERRCLYVALTRAKDRLYIYRTISAIHAEESNNSYDKDYFFNDLPESLCNFRSLSQYEYGDDKTTYKGEQLEIGMEFNFD